MGNKIARTTQASATEYYLHDLKVYFKRAGEPIDLKEHERRLERIRNAFKGIEGSHVFVLPFQVWLQTDKAAYLSTSSTTCTID